MDPKPNKVTMTRDNLRAQLENTFFQDSIREKIEAYEDLVATSDISAVETFDSPQGQVVFEVRRRIRLIKRLAEDVGMTKIVQRVDQLLESFE